MQMKILIIVLGFFIFNVNAFAESESILVSKSIDMKDVLFDGKWTHSFEWKRSSLDIIDFKDVKKFYLRSAHYEDFIYFHINFIVDGTPDKGIDHAIICIDSKNEKNKISDNNDYCFIVVLDEREPVTLQGGTMNKLNGNFKKILNHEEFIGIGSMSDKNDRYSKTPHASYEFRIPTDIVGRNDNYGFYVSVFDGNKNENFSWPEEAMEDTELKIPSPSKWGNLVSPDKSLPEFDAILLLPITIVLVLLTSKIKWGHQNLMLYE